MNVKLVGAVVFLVISIILIKCSNKNNVCTTFEDYYTNRDRNKNCYYNPDEELSVPDVIRRWGYPVETHYVTTEDGYILTLFRIPYGKDTISKRPGPPVLIQHGYKSNSKCFVSTGRKSLGFILAEKDYDVWLGNFRGTAYSTNHTHLSDRDEQFWSYSFHEMGVYDVAAEIDYIYEKRKDKVIYIGFSLGTTTATIYSSIRPKLAEQKVKIFIKLAPFIYTKGISPLTSLGLTLVPFVKPIAHFFTNGQYYTKTFGNFNAALWKFVCYPYPIQMKICQVFDMWTFGFNYEQNDPETLPVTLMHLTETTSVKTVTHLSQLLYSKRFQQFDYGPEENLQVYGFIHPPEYNLTNLKVPTYIVRAENDYTSTKEAVEKFYASLPNHVKPHSIYVVNDKYFNHINYLWGKDVVPILYNHLIQFIDSLN